MLELLFTLCYLALGLEYVAAQINSKGWPRDKPWMAPMMILLGVPFWPLALIARSIILIKWTYEERV